jgi:methyltransferase (TIGR00027 family)
MEGMDVDPSIRHDNDTWDLATSVGATATMVAAARGAASKAGDLAIDDPFAEPLVRAVGIDFFTHWAGGELDLSDDGSRRVLQWFVDLMAVRTRYFDDFLRNATGAGIRQVVILASGLDARSYRLPWPSGSMVFEVDQPTVIEFKTATLARLNVEPAADLRMVPIDLRQDWPTSLRRAGFDPGRPTAWIAEGLLPFLSPDAQDRLLDSITALSATESQLATEIFVPLTRDMLQPVLQRWGSHGFDIVPSNLVYDGERHDVAVYLDNRGWQSVTTPMSRLLAANDLDPRGDQSPFADNRYYTSTKSAGST